ncbi:MAG: hypothetical protein WC827_04260 [Candidatus Paceibacterota bacterium]|jgi:hypothetical protein
MKADTTKLASSFKAWRLTLGTEPHNIKKAIKHCEQLGLLPKVCGYQEDMILFSITLPYGKFSHPQAFVNHHMDYLHAAIFHGTTVELICPVEKSMCVEVGFHQIDADINFPTDPQLLREALTDDEVLALCGLIGRKELERIASVTHEHGPNPDYDALAKQEGNDLIIIRQAIIKMTGKSHPWIIGFASEFAGSLLSMYPTFKS